MLGYETILILNNTNRPISSTVSKLSRRYWSNFRCRVSYLFLTQSFSVISDNVAMDHVSLKTRFFWATFFVADSRPMHLTFVVIGPTTAGLRDDRWRALCTVTEPLAELGTILIFGEKWRQRRRRLINTYACDAGNRHRFSTQT